SAGAAAVVADDDRVQLGVGRGGEDGEAREERKRHGCTSRVLQYFVAPALTASSIVCCSAVTRAAQTSMLPGPKLPTGKALPAGVRSSVAGTLFAERSLPSAPRDST